MKVTPLFPTARTGTLGNTPISTTIFHRQKGPASNRWGPRFLSLSRFFSLFFLQTQKGTAVGQVEKPRLCGCSSNFVDATILDSRLERPAAHHQPSLFFLLHRQSGR
jgi:hypothetical protein